jgi:aryl-alcohol dehydrogenase-like predicted oxidoreductase
MPLDAGSLPPLTLGTAQIGLDYGIANRIGRPDDRAADAIMDAAWGSGLTCFDTARAYGDAEARIGGWMARRKTRPLLITKVAALEAVGEGGLAEAVHVSFGESRRALGVERIDGLLLHAAADLDRRGVVDALRGLEDDEAIGAFGVSVYRAEEIDRALRCDGLSLIQAPLSAFNQAAASSGALGRCAEAGVVVLARSVFVQGLLFLDAKALPGHLAGLAGALDEMRALAHDAGLTIAQLALAAVRGLPAVGSIVVGADQAAHVEALAAAIEMPVPAPRIVNAVRALAGRIDPRLVDPTTWIERP